MYKEAIEIGKCSRNYNSSMVGTFSAKHGCQLYTGEKEDGRPKKDSTTTEEAAIATNENF